MMSWLPTQVWNLIVHADIMSSAVLLLLLVFSIACWATLLYKLIQLRTKKREIDRLQKQIQHISDISRFAPMAVSSSTGVTYLVNSVTGRINIYLKRSSSSYLSVKEWEDIQMMIEQLVEQVVHEAESGLSFLATSAAVAPLLGLFGTVWGLIQAFLAIGQMKTADIAAVAPGIAQALITTLAGLLVAIPAVLMYNYLSSKARSFEQELIGFCDRWGFLVQHTLVR